MFSIADYEVIQDLHEGKKTVVYRAVHRKSRQPVIIKTLKAEYPPLDEVVRWKREYEIAKGIESDGVVKPLALEPYKNGVALILEDFGGASLHHHLTFMRLTLAQCLEIAVVLAETIGVLHQHQIMHKDIKPPNIIVNLTDGSVKLTDFGIASLLSSERQEMLSPNQLEGTLHYMSPEQTGRMNRVIDYRTDFYSFGVTLYEMLTGQLPFQGTDPVEMIHCHIAKEATPPCGVNASIPQVISDIVMRCLAKNAEDRYQSAFGLQRDLELCLTQLRETGAVGSFAVGSRDRSEVFQIPQKLYGRERDLRTMWSVFERVSDGSSELLLVSGFSGIGKSSLVQELHKPVVHRSGTFISGKFDQFKRHIPYYALIQALTQLIHQLLTESEQEIANWRERMLTALGPNAQVLIDVIPELELIIGKQAPVQELPPMETQNRFQLTVHHLLSLFSKKEHPLVIFLDDLQWADLASLNLMEYILCDPSTSHLLLFGAYRDNEVTASHRLAMLIEDLESKGVPLQQLFLRQFEPEHVRDLVADAMQCEPERAQALAELVMKKTNGNPFFVKQFLQTLHAQGLLRFDYASGSWTWDEEQIRTLDITDNVVEFMVGKVKQLSGKGQDVLKAAACIGNSFDLQTLALSLGQSLTETSVDLWEVLQEGFILPVGTGYNLLYGREQGELQVLPEEFNVWFKFLHDRVQQVAYAMIPEERLAQVHLNIGLLIKQRRGTDEQDESIFEMINHLNAGAALIRATEEIDELIRLNLLAGRKAKASTAYESAHRYLMQGMQLLGEEGWQSHYDLTFALYQERSEVEYILGHFEVAEAYFDQLLARSKNVEQKSEIYRIKMILYKNQGRYRDVVELGVQAAKVLGYQIPAKASKGMTLLELLLARRGLRKFKRMEDLVELPEMTDPNLRAFMRVMLEVGQCCYTVDQNLYAYLILRTLNITFKHGTSIASGSAYGAFGFILGAVLGEYERGYQLSKVAFQVEERFAHELSRSAGYHSFAAFVNHWVRPLRSNLDYLRYGYQLGLERGDLLNASSSLANRILTLFLAGDPLPEVEAEHDKHFDFLLSVQQENTLHNLHLIKAMLLNLRGGLADRFSLSYGDFDAPAMRDRVLSDNHFATLSLYHTLHLMLLTLRGEHRLAVDVAAEGEPFISRATGQIQVGEFTFYQGVALAGCYAQASDVEKRQFRKQLAICHKKLRKWAKHGPDNYVHRERLVAAEIAKLRGREREAMQLYDEAISRAEAQGFLQHFALANECAAKFYLQIGMFKVAKTYMMEAEYAYVRWGATSKAKDLDARYPDLLATRFESDSRLEAAAATTETILATQEHTNRQLDMLSVVKSASAISGEIVLDKLLENMINIVVENAGAQKGFLMIERDETLWIEAEKNIESGDLNVLRATPFRISKELSTSVIQYVRRMKEHVVLHDASKAEMFAKDPYMRKKRPKSILCMPLINQGKLVGILYLENNLTLSAFTSERLEVLKLLSAQIAVSIENAQLYNQQVELNKAYEKFVPHQFLRFLEKRSITDVSLGDHVQTEMSVLFSDIRSFTTMSEQMTPVETFQFLNGYLSEMEPCIIENRGFIDKYIGDSIMALFDKGADDAVRAGLAMLRQLDRYNKRRLAQGELPIRIGLGINSGRLMLGTLGGNHRMDSTVISDAVNLASRIEGLTKRYQASLLIGEQTYSRLKDPIRYAIRLIDRVRVKGKSEEVSVYEVFDADPEEVREGKRLTRQRFEEAVLHYHNQDFERARRWFEGCLELNPQDMTAKVYIERCQHCLLFGYDDHWGEPKEERRV